MKISTETLYRLCNKYQWFTSGDCGVYRVRNREFENVTHNCFPAYAEFKCEIVHLFVTTFANNL